MRKTGNGDPVPYLRAALELSPGAGLALELLDSVYLERQDEVSRARLRRDEMEAPLIAQVDYLRRTSRLLEEERYDEVISHRARWAPDRCRKRQSDVQFGAGAFEDARTVRAVRSSCSTAFVRENRRDRNGRCAACGTARARRKVRRRARRARSCLRRSTIERGRAACSDRVCLQSLGRASAAEAGLRAAMSRGRKRIGLELASLMLREGRFADAQMIAEEALASA